MIKLVLVVLIFDFGLNQHLMEYRIILFLLVMVALLYGNMVCRREFFF